MYSFFVLGLIPGTSIQISFTMWVEAALAVTFSALLLRSVLHRRHAVTFLPPSIGADNYTVIIGPTQTA